MALWREFEGSALISNWFSARKTNRSCNQSFSVRKSYHGKGYVLRRRPQAEQGRLWDIRIPKTAADFRLWERRVEKQPAAHLIRSFPGSARENIRVSSSGNNQPEPEKSCRGRMGWAGTYLTSGPAAVGYGAAGTLAALRARRALPPCGRHEPAGRQSGTRGLLGGIPQSPRRIRLLARPTGTRRTQQGPGAQAARVRNLREALIPLRYPPTVLRP